MGIWHYLLFLSRKRGNTPKNYIIENRAKYKKLADTTEKKIKN